MAELLELVRGAAWVLLILDAAFWLAVAAVVWWRKRRGASE